VNGRTEGRHASSVEDVRGILTRGVDKLAEHRRTDGTGEGDGSSPESGSTDGPTESP
jgi:hypothetical protein